MDAGSIGTWVGVGVGVVGIIVAIVLATRKTPPSQNTQTQSVRGGSFNVQSGRDTTVNSAASEETSDND